jgi:hypothetical protein
MGGIVDSIFGGGGKKAAKKAAAYTKEMFNEGKALNLPFITGGQGAYGALGGMLGLGGTGEQDAAFKNYMDSTGYKFLLESGSKAVTGNMASRGLLKSGATLKALENFGQNLAATKTQEYMNNLLGMSSIGANAAGNVMGAGLQSAGLYGQQKMAGAQSQADAWGSVFNLALSAAGAASERRVKTAIEKVGEFTDGLGLYLFRYVWGGPTQWGVMVDEVETLRPWALGPTVDGVRTVDYARI